MGEILETGEAAVTGERPAAPDQEALVRRKELRRVLAERTAALMFFLSVLFLANVAALLVLWVDVPRISRDHEHFFVNLPDHDAFAWPAALDSMALDAGNFCLGIVALLWPIFILEFVVYSVSGRGLQAPRDGLLGCICPPLRLGWSNPGKRKRIWLPGLRWRRVNEVLRQRLERVFGYPMIVIAMLILPVLLVEFGMQEQIARHLWLRVLIHLSTGTIWFAFTLEFIVMCSVAERKLVYCKEHVIDLAIIVLPLISFLRSLRLVRATRLARLAKVQQLAKMSRVYRLRGLAVRALRALMLFEVINKILRNTPEKQVRALRAKLEETEREARSLRRRIETLERLIDDD